ncbi:MAG: GTP cyclohydrolase I FolE2 [Candidatus Brockarchaeota archaeon]|nr:GTP cyclohydrolase I FolE2 [Candidatus Brockarchaeota archaeon]
MRGILEDVKRETNASSVEVRFDYPFFIEKLTPVDKEKCLVRYMCSLTGRATALREKPRIIFKIDAPIITTYPASVPEEPGGLFGQLSIVSIEVESDETIYPEDLAEMADEYALAPIYSFLTERDQFYIIKKIHSEYKYSVTVVDQIREALAKNRKIKWYAVNSHNYGMLHNYSTLVTIEKGMWIPFSTYEEGT